MKVLSEADQIRKRREEVWDARQFIYHEYNEKAEKSNAMEDSFFASGGKKRIAKYHAKEYQKVLQAIEEYHDSLGDQLQKVLDKQK